MAMQPAPLTALRKGLQPLWGGQGSSVCAKGSQICACNSVLAADTKKDTGIPALLALRCSVSCSGGCGCAWANSVPCLGYTGSVCKCFALLLYSLSFPSRRKHPSSIRARGTYGIFSGVTSEQDNSCSCGCLPEAAQAPGRTRLLLPVLPAAFPRPAEDADTCTALGHGLQLSLRS